VEERQMHVLHLLNDGPEAACADLLRLKSTELEVEVIDLSRADVDYGKLIEKIFASDKVVSW
jgi:hypothetical protein